jgi:hypothetical protein
VTGPVCQSCGAAIIWRVTVDGRRIPLDREPAAAGVVRMLSGAQCLILSKQNAALAQGGGERLWMPHHATCPTRARHQVPRSQLSLEL